MKYINSFYNFLLEEFEVGNIAISDMEKYLQQMTKGFADKLFFLNLINVDILVDFGSADGQMLDKLSKIKPNMILLGYDIDEKMIEQSKQKFPHINFTDKWDEVISFLNKKEFANKTKGMLLSSVIHEVYSYAGGKNIKNFWEEQCFNDVFDYMIIRDMMPSKRFEKMNIVDVKKIKDKSDPVYLQQFEKRWGNINNDFRTLLHWLLKYKYTENWDRELNENYLPVTIETFKERKIPSNWRIIYENHYTYDYIRQQIKEDFGVTINEPTHLKMILKKK